MQLIASGSARGTTYVPRPERVQRILIFTADGLLMLCVAEAACHRRERRALPAALSCEINDM